MTINGGTRGPVYEIEGKAAEVRVALCCAEREIEGGSGIGSRDTCDRVTRGKQCSDRH